MIAIIAFCVGFILSGLIAGWAGMWTRPAKDCYVCSLRKTDDEAQDAESEPAWYDFVRNYPVISWFDGSLWREFWGFVSRQWGWSIPGIILIAIIAIYNSTLTANAEALVRAKSWCSRRGCEAIGCSHEGPNSVLLCEIRFPGQSVEWRDCRGHECSKP